MNTVYQKSDVLSKYRLYRCEKFCKRIDIGNETRTWGYSNIPKTLSNKTLQNIKHYKKGEYILYKISTAIYYKLDNTAQKKYCTRIGSYSTKNNIALTDNYCTRCQVKYQIQVKHIYFKKLETNNDKLSFILGVL